MNVSLQLTKTAPSFNAGKCMVLCDVTFDTALAISTSLRDLTHADLDAVILVEELLIAKPLRAGFLASRLRSLRHAAASAPPR
jgi:hypothetical protein